MMEVEEVKKINYKKNGRAESATRLSDHAVAPNRERMTDLVATRLSEHIVEIISDSGEGAQKCGQSFGAIVARMGNGVWTVEIIPAEIRAPALSVAGGSGNRIR